jgi:DegV family protein with EDD domain
VVYVGLSRAVSGTLQSGEHAAARTNSGRVQVFDTFNAAAGQALLVWRAAELAEAGADASTILAEMERLKPLTLLWAMTRDISHVVRGGRIPAWAAPLARISALTPVARIRENGTLGLSGVLFARERAPEAFARRVAKQLPAGQCWRVIVGHCDAPEEGARLLAALRERIAITDAFVVETGAAIGAHAGQGALIVAVQPAPSP